MTVDSNNSSTSTPSNELIVFDFDETIVECNTDTFINMLAPDGQIPSNISNVLNDGSDKIWTDYMQLVFNYLFENDVRKENYCECFKQIQFVPGMIDLINNLCNKNQINNKIFELIIISDANSFSIGEILKQNNLYDCFSQIFTNPAEFDADGCLKIKYYHEQNECPLSAKNLCKGNVLEKYLKQQANAKQIKYDRIHYVGDGQNDLCPSLRLSSTDFVYPRNGYKLHKLIEQHQISNTLKAKSIPFNNGLDIWNNIVSN